MLPWNKVYVPLDEHLKELRDNDKEAVNKAFAAANRLAETHNDLIRKMDTLILTFSTKEEVNNRFNRTENFQSKIIGGLMVVAFIGFANFIKVWFG